MPASQGLTSADSGKPTGAVTPADALEVIQRMSQSQADRKESTECPTCGRTDFKNKQGLRMHHAKTHGESLKYVTVECDWCGADVEKDHSYTDGRNFCDQDCRGEWLSEHQSGEDNPNWGSVYVTCDRCGDEFPIWPSQLERGRGRYCSSECMYAALSERFTGEGSPSWRGGYEDYYGPSWPDQRRRARERDDHTCQACGTHELELETALSVHHIRPFRLFDSHEAANALDNLVSLCRSCHARWEGIPLRPEVNNNET